MGKQQGVRPPCLRGVQPCHPVLTPTCRLPPTRPRAHPQIAACLQDIGADVVKTGMLPTPEVRAAGLGQLRIRCDWTGPGAPQTGLERLLALPHALLRPPSPPAPCPPPLQVVEAVAEELQAQGLVRLVVDPVLVSTSGDPLATAGEYVASGGG